MVEVERAYVSYNFNWKRLKSRTCRETRPDNEKRLSTKAMTREQGYESQHSVGAGLHCHDVIKHPMRVLLNTVDKWWRGGNEGGQTARKGGDGGG